MTKEYRSYYKADIRAGKKDRVIYGSIPYRSLSEDLSGFYEELICRCDH